MKMFGPKSLSFYLFIASRLLAVGGILLIALILFSLGIDDFILNGDQFSISLPFTKTTIRGVYHSGIIKMITMYFVFYIVFLFLLSQLFKAFKAKTVFTDNAVKRLNQFALWNLFAPIAYIILHSTIQQDAVFTHLPYALLHFVLGLIILFVSALIKKGGKLQQEIDLTI